MQAFDAGKMIKNAVQAKNFQWMSSGIGALLTAAFTISQGFGYHIPVDQETINQIGSGAGALYLTINAIITVVTSEKVGFKE